MNNRNTLFSMDSDNHLAHLMLSSSLTARDGSANTRWLTGDYDRLIEPLLLLKMLERNLTIQNVNAEALLEIYRRLLSSMDAWKGLRTFHPTLSHFAELVIQAEQNIPSTGDVDLELLQRMPIISKLLQSDEHKRLVAEWLWAGDRNLRIGLRALVAITLNYPSFVAVGVELTYEHANTPLEQVVQDRQQLLSEIRNIPELEHCIGAYWHLEYGLQKGYYLQCVFFFPTKEPSVGHILAQHLGEHWQTTVTKGDGRYHANTREQTEYQYPGCIHVQESNHDRLEQVDWWLKCMTYPDVYFPLVLPAGESTFDTQTFKYYLRSQDDWTDVSLFEAEIMSEWYEDMCNKA
ncbi:hypothetical protein [Serratia fonticola]|uniref:hypothetical protein n=1 Tax=Serratia fonticola TaxID=47917 RepID=UPI0034C65B15